MTIRSVANSMLRKAIDVVSAPFRIGDRAGYRNALSQLGATSDCSITPHRALQLSVVFSCTRLIAETIATLPLLVYRRRNGGGRDVDTNHPLYALLHDSPNADQTATEFWEVVVIDLILRGRAFVHKGVDINGTVFSLTPLDYDRMGSPVRLANGAWEYPYNHPTRGPVRYSQREIWAISSFGGLSVVQLGARSMGAAVNAEQAASKLYSNDLKPGFVTVIKEWLNASQRKQMKDAIADSIGGSTETGGRFRLIEGGMEFKQLTLSPEDAQLLETRTFSVEDLCRWFSVPPSMIGHGTAVSNWGTGREQQNLGFLQYVLRPYLKRIEQGIYKSLLSPEERRRVYAQFSVEGLLRADSAGRAAFYASGITHAWLKPSEVRDLEDLPPEDGSDILVMQSNMIPVSLLGQGNTAPEAVDAIDALKRALGIEEKTNET